MECPNCGELSSAKLRVSGARTSHDLARTRQRKCLSCGEVFFSVEIPIEREHVTCYRHYHIREDVLFHLIKALHGYGQS